jgi:4-hydroxy-tetrahydrodipicolinate synthase
MPAAPIAASPFPFQPNRFVRFNHRATADKERPMRTLQPSPALSGSFTALITPFRSGDIDEIALRRLVDFQIEHGISGLVPCGTTGESVTLTETEHNRVIEIVVDQSAGRVPVIAGTGSNNTAATIERTRQSQAAGADAALIVVPYYNKPTQEGMIRHYSAIAEATSLPIVLYNVPGRTGVNLLPESFAQLSAIPNIVAIKEAGGNLDQVSEILTSVSEDFGILSGDDSLTLPIMSVGGHGVISVVSNIAPAPVAQLVNACLRGDFHCARDIHHRIFDLCRAMFIENNPTAVKTAAAMLGLCSDEVRLPLISMGEANRRRLAEALSRAGLVEPKAA